MLQGCTVPQGQHHHRERRMGHTSKESTTSGSRVGRGFGLRRVTLLCGMVFNTILLLHPGCHTHFLIFILLCSAESRTTQSAPLLSPQQTPCRSVDIQNTFSDGSSQAQDMRHGENGMLGMSTPCANYHAKYHRGKVASLNLPHF